MGLVLGEYPVTLSYCGEWDGRGGKEGCVRLERDVEERIVRAWAFVGRRLKLTTIGRVAWR